MAKPKKDLQCAEVTVETCGDVRKMLLEIYNKMEQDYKDGIEGCPTMPRIVLTILRKEAKKYFAEP